ncbi:MAG: tetratricopeptide repeat protein [Candidatus Zixiibacteriota bacterium]
MQSKVKLTKRQVKEDKFTTFMLTSKDKLQGEFEEKWQYYVIGLVVTVVAVWAVIWFFNQRSDRAVAAAEAYSKAMIAYQSGDNLNATLELNKVLSDYGGYDVAGNAALMLGNLNLSNRSYDEALRHYRIYLDDYGGPLFNRAAAQAGIATVQEDQAQHAEAAASFVKAAEMYPDGPLRPDYELGAIRNYLAGGEIDKADARLAILKDEYANSDWTNRAIRMIAEKKQSG